MQQARRTLSIRAPEPEPVLAPEEAIARAIERRLCLEGVYNRAQVKLAPHILYTRHDDPFVDAMVVERDGKAPREIKLGVFKLAGLKEVRLTSTPFAPLPDFDPGAETYAERVIQSVAG